MHRDNFFISVGTLVWSDYELFHSGLFSSFDATSGISFHIQLILGLPCRIMHLDVSRYCTREFVYVQNLERPSRPAWYSRFLHNATSSGTRPRRGRSSETTNLTRPLDDRTTHGCFPSNFNLRLAAGGIITFLLPCFLSRGALTIHGHLCFNVHALVEFQFCYASVAL
jgi:hypothetical protein